MPTLITLPQIAKLAPNARSSYRSAFEQGQAILDRYEISANRLRVAHFMAQILHESGGMTIQFENMNYSAERLPMVWPKRFQPIGPLDPAAYAHNPEKLGNSVYGGRMGNLAPGDGYLYRGRGLLQLTGKASYREANTLLSAEFPDVPDFVALPDAVVSAAWCLKVAAVEWFKKGCNEKADTDSVLAVTMAINGGQIGLASRKEWLKRTKNIWPS
jgi:putative chitinase